MYDPSGRSVGTPHESGAASMRRRGSHDGFGRSSATFAHESVSGDGMGDGVPPISRRRRASHSSSVSAAFDIKSSFLHIRSLPQLRADIEATLQKTSSASFSLADQWIKGLRLEVAAYLYKLTEGDGRYSSLSNSHLELADEFFDNFKGKLREDRHDHCLLLAMVELYARKYHFIKHVVRPTSFAEAMRTSYTVANLFLLEWEALYEFAKKNSDDFRELLSYMHYCRRVRVFSAGNSSPRWEAVGEYVVKRVSSEPDLLGDARAGAGAGTDSSLEGEGLLGLSGAGASAAVGAGTDLDSEGGDSLSPRADHASVVGAGSSASAVEVDSSVWKIDEHVELDSPAFVWQCAFITARLWRLRKNELEAAGLQNILPVWLRFEAEERQVDLTLATGRSSADTSSYIDAEHYCTQLLAGGLSDHDPRQGMLELAKAAQKLAGQRAQVIRILSGLSPTTRRMLLTFPDSMVEYMNNGSVWNQWGTKVVDALLWNIGMQHLCRSSDKASVALKNWNDIADAFMKEVNEEGRAFGLYVEPNHPVIAESMLYIIMARGYLKGDSAEKTMQQFVMHNVRNVQLNKWNAEEYENQTLFWLYDIFLYGVDFPMDYSSTLMSDFIRRCHSNPEVATFIDHCARLMIPAQQVAACLNYIFKKNDARFTRFLSDLVKAYEARQVDEAARVGATAGAGAAAGAAASASGVALASAVFPASPTDVSAGLDSASAVDVEAETLAELDPGVYNNQASDRLDFFLTLAPEIGLQKTTYADNLWDQLWYKCLEAGVSPQAMKRFLIGEGRYQTNFLGKILCSVTQSSQKYALKQLVEYMGIAFFQMLAREEKDQHEKGYKDFIAQPLLLLADMYVACERNRRVDFTFLVDALKTLGRRQACMVFYALAQLPRVSDLAVTLKTSAILRQVSNPIFSWEHADGLHMSPDFWDLLDRTFSGPPDSSFKNEHARAISLLESLAILFRDEGSVSKTSWGVLEAQAKLLLVFESSGDEGYVRVNRSDLLMRLMSVEAAALYKAMCCHNEMKVRRTEHKGSRAVISTEVGADLVVRSDTAKAIDGQLQGFFADDKGRNSLFDRSDKVGAYEISPQLAELAFFAWVRWINHEVRRVGRSSKMRDHFSSLVTYVLEVDESRLLESFIAAMSVFSPCGFTEGSKEYALYKAMLTKMRKPSASMVKALMASIVPLLVSSRQEHARVEAILRNEIDPRIFDTSLCVCVDVVHMDDTLVKELGMRVIDENPADVHYSLPGIRVNRGCCTSRTRDQQEAQAAVYRTVQTLAKKHFYHAELNSLIQYFLSGSVVATGEVHTTLLGVLRDPMFGALRATYGKNLLESEGVLALWSVVVLRINRELNWLSADAPLTQRRETLQEAMSDFSAKLSARVHGSWKIAGYNLLGAAAVYVFKQTKQTVDGSSERVAVNPVLIVGVTVVILAMVAIALGHCYLRVRDEGRSLRGLFSCRPCRRRRDVRDVLPNVLDQGEASESGSGAVAGAAATAAADGRLVTSNALAGYPGQRKTGGGASVASSRHSFQVETASESSAGAGRSTRKR